MFSREERERYQRQVHAIGERGQERLRESRVLIAGAGGLGCPIATYLAAAGSGFIRIVDSDVVERSNLNRQFLYGEEDIGRNKVDAACTALTAINPHTEVEGICAAIDAGTARGFAEDMDIIMDASDNFAMRYLLNRAALDCGIPFIHGAVDGFYGQVSTIIPGESACLRCICPAPPPAEKVSVIGVTCGVVGSVQTGEAVKYLTGRGGSLLTNRILLWDGLRCDATVIAVMRDKHCPDCGDGGV